MVGKRGESEEWIDGICARFFLNVRGASYLLILFLMLIAFQTAQASAIRHCIGRRSSPASICIHVLYVPPAPSPTTSSTDCDIRVLRDFDVKAWGVAWERDLSSEVGIDLDSDSRAHKMYASLAGPRAESVFVLKPDLTPPHPAQPTSLAPLSDPTRSSRRTTTRTPDAPIVTLAAYSAPPLRRIRSERCGPRELIERVVVFAFNG